MLVNTKEMLDVAKKEKYAVPQYNINNLEWTKAILEVMEEEKLPVILGVSEGAAKYMGGYNTVVMMIKGLMNDLKITIPVAIHLDHGSSFETCKLAIDSGFTSVMIDASKLSLEENFTLTKKVVDYANLHNVTVEAEIGHIGGEEDGIKADILYANYEDCLYLEKSGISSLAAAVGSSHGIYKGEPNLSYDLINKLNESMNVPLVLHGGSGISPEKIIKAVNSGISKINVNTELQLSWYNEIRKYINDNPNVYDPRKVISSGVCEIKRIIKEKNKLFFRR